MNAFRPGWFVIYTKPRHERKVAEQLENTGISHFLPLIKSLKTWSDRKKYVDAPLFPSYVFVRLDDMQTYFSTLKMNGILHYVRSGNQVASVSDTVIHNLQLLIANTPAGIEISSEYFHPGKILVIREGPFTGFYCEVIRHNGKQKILVRIELLQRNILIDQPVEYLMPSPMLL